MDARTKDILEAFGHEPYSHGDGWQCDHPRHHGDTFETLAELERACLAISGDQYELDMERDGTHPALGYCDGSGR